MMVALRTSNSLWARSWRFMWRQPWFGLIMAGALFLFIMGPMLNVFLWAFTQRWSYPSLLPTTWGVQYWPDTFRRADIAAGFVSSVWISLTVTALSAVICLPAAYAFARLRFPGRTVFLLSFLATNAFPRFGLYITIAVIFFRLHLVGTVAGVVLIQLVNTLLFMIWIPTAAFQGVDRALEEAGFGCRGFASACILADYAASRSSSPSRGFALDFRGSLLRDPGGSIDRCARSPHIADSDNYLNQQPSNSAVWGHPLGHVMGAFTAVAIGS